MTSHLHVPLRALLLKPFTALLLASLICLGLRGVAAAQSDDAAAAPPPSVTVHPQFGGQILGFGVDQGGTEGLLSEYVSEGGGLNLVAC